MVLGIQIVGALFGLFMVYMVYLHMKRKEFTAKESFVWIVIWVVFIIIAAAPGVLDFIVKDVLNISRPLDFFVISGIMVLSVLTFYNYVLLRKSQTKIEEIVRKIAFEKEEKK